MHSDTCHAIVNADEVLKLDTFNAIKFTHVVGVEDFNHFSLLILQMAMSMSIGSILSMGRTDSNPFGSPTRSIMKPALNRQVSASRSLSSSLSCSRLASAASDKIPDLAIGGSSLS